jgi:streptogramin lyase
MHRNLHTAAALTLATLLTGCGLSAPGTGTGTAGTATASAKFSGHVFGGQQPVSGSTIQLYTVGTTGIASASAPLIAATVTSDAGGNFSITGQYTCSAATQVYVTATGGNAGSGINTSLRMMASLGSCATLLANANTTFLSINELTTVAAVEALAPFMADTTHIGATGSNPTGLVNAFATANALVNTSVGQIAYAPTGVTLPVARLNTLADILAACINTNGVSSTQCTALYTATGATNTIDAALAIAKQPAAPAITALYSLPGATPPFVPALSAQPSDFTLAMNITNPALLTPYAIALDAVGNAWVAGETSASLVKLSAPSPAFAATSYPAGLTAPRALAIDPTGNIFVANTGANSIVKLLPNGTASAFATGAALSAPVALASDSTGSLWVANFAGNSVLKLSSTGATTSTLTTSLSAPSGIAIDSAGRVAIANSGTGSVCLYSNAAVLQSCPQDNALFGPTAVAISPTGALAMSGSTTGAALAGAFTLATSTGTLTSPTPVSGGGLTLPTAVAYDSAGTAWFANTGSLSAFTGSTPLTPAAGYASLSAPQSIAVDPSGNLWTANSGDNSVSVLIGLAAPTTTPLAANVGP